MTHLQLITPIEHHTSIHSTPQHVTHQDDSYDYYYATEEFMDSLVNNIIQQSPTIFAAMKRVDDINKINGYQVVSSFNVQEIKSSFTKIENGNIKSRQSQRGDNEIWKKQREEYTKDKMKELQRGYMVLLSNQ